MLTLDAHPQNFYESGKVALESGITSSDLYYNVTGNGSAVQFSGGGTSAQLSGILLASFRDVHLLPGLIYWREIIGDSNILTLRSGAAAVPEPPGLVDDWNRCSVPDGGAAPVAAAGLVA